MHVVLVAVAGALGALSRYGIGRAVGTTSFPWATLGINVVGCAALGYVLGGPGRDWSPDVTTAVAAGFLGAFTTFSTFGYETTALVRDGRAPAAALYVGLSVAAGLAAAALGWVAGKGT